MTDQEEDRREELELMERFEMALRFHGHEERAEEEFAKRLKWRAKLLADLQSASYSELMTGGMQ